LPATSLKYYVNIFIIHLLLCKIIKKNNHHYFDQKVEVGETQKQITYAELGLSLASMVVQLYMHHNFIFQTLP